MALITWCSFLEDGLLEDSLLEDNACAPSDGPLRAGRWIPTTGGMLPAADMETM
jgi:hypothetical protein